MKTLQSRLPREIRSLKSLPVLVIAAFMAIAGSWFSLAYADQYQDQIQNLETQNLNNQAEVNTLQTQAKSYQDEINQLKSQIASIESQISSNQAQQATVQAKINVVQGQINQQKQVLGEDLKAMYESGQMSTVEMLATSKSLSSFVDAETYDSAVQGKIQQELDQITVLENKLKSQQSSLQALLQGMQTQQSQLSSDEAAQNNLLSMNQSQQSAYNQKIAANAAQISKLQAEDIAANTSGVQQVLSRGTCGGGYPNNLCNATQDSIVDPWHMLNRECVSYAAFRAAEESSIANMLLQEYSFGNAGSWPASARAYGAKYGVTVSTTPQVGDIAIRPAIPGVYVAPGDPDVGHAMYVEAVNGGGTIVVSEYNEYLDGTYSEEVRSTSGTYHGTPYQLQFIHFPS